MKLKKDRTICVEIILFRYTELTYRRDQLDYDIVTDMVSVHNGSRSRKAIAQFPLRNDRCLQILEISHIPLEKCFTK